MAKIFVVEDNAGLSEAIISYLSIEGHNPILFDRVNGVVEAAAMAQPDLIILDVMLPDGNGFNIARKIKEEADIPIMFLTARSSESDRITGFELGADDYVVKPFSMRELVLRVRSLLARVNRSTAQTEDHHHLFIHTDEKGVKHTLELDEDAHTCSQDGKEIKLTATEWKIIFYLAVHHHTLISREQLLGQCLDYLAEGSQRSINTHMKNIRAKLEQVNWVETVRGFGYRFIGENDK
ncbi:MAG: response regulator transcription factor [Sphaerochaetaceae bacterium]|nr:response regulator transcription factor [Sphaerochaetaceae bacterium]